MFSRCLRAGFVVAGVSLLSLSTPASAQLPTNVQRGVSLQGTIVVLGSGKIGVITADAQRWVVQVSNRTSVMLTGKGDATLLRPGMFVRFQADVNRQRQVARPVESIQVFTPTRQDVPGATPRRGPGPVEGAKSAPPAKEAEGAEVTTTYDVVGRITEIAEGKVIVSFGRGSLAIELAEAARVDLAVADISFARPGDQITCNGMPVGFQAARTMSASSIQITRAQPARSPDEDAATGTSKTADGKSKSSDKGQEAANPLVTLLTPKPSKRGKASVESFTIEGDPTEFRPALHLAVASLERRFGPAQKSQVKGTMTIGGHSRPGTWQMWSWKQVKVIVDSSRKSRFFAIGK